MKLISLILPALLITACSTVQNNSQLPYRVFPDTRPELVNLMDDFPKGADLHNHASGAKYIEFGIIDAVENNHLYDVKKHFLVRRDESYQVYEEDDSAYKDGCRYWKGKNDCLIPARELLSNNWSEELKDFLDLVSIRGWYRNAGNGQDHFFNAFDHLDVPQEKNEYLAEIIARNHGQGVRYVELMTSSLPKSLIQTIANKLGDNPVNGLHLDQLYVYIKDTLNGEDFKRAVIESMDEREINVDKILRQRFGITITGDQPDIIVKYIPQLYRDSPIKSIFVSAVVNLKASKIDHRIAAINLVTNEAGINAMMNFYEQMEVLDFLWKKLGEPNIALHAGELVLRESPLEPMRDRISHSIKKGHAKRIGHGVSIAWEDDTESTLQLMAEQEIAIEICLSSNDIILGVAGRDHPLKLYLDYGVPVTISTDDEAVSRSNLTMEYVRAVEEHQLSYEELKRIAKNGLEYGFLSGDSIYLPSGDIKSNYINYLESELPKLSEIGEKAYLQIRHERDIAEFESKHFKELF